MINKKSQSSTPLEKAINAVGGSQKVLAEKVALRLRPSTCSKSEVAPFQLKKCASTKKLPGFPVKFCTQESLPPDRRP
jgi:hypothetical protein